MDNIVEQIKERVHIEDLVESMGVRLQKRHGRYLKGQEHDSLVIDTHNQCYFWNSQSESGDVFNWVMARKKVDFRGALEYLAEHARVPLPEFSGGDMQVRLAARAKEDAFQVAARVFNRWLTRDEKTSQKALEYVRGRGFTDDTISKAMLGFSGTASATDHKEMAAEFALYGVDPKSPAAVAITGFKGDVAAWLKEHNINADECRDWIEWGYIPGMMGRKRLVYPHVYHGRVKTLSGRNILGDEISNDREIKSYNLPVILAGQRQLYFNWQYGSRSEEVVIVEGAGDADALGQLGIAAIATGGTAWKDNEALFAELRQRHETLYIASDADDAGQKVIQGKDNDYPLADLLGPMLKVVRWPAKDANDWLKEMLAKGKADDEQAEEARDILDNAKPIVMVVAAHAGGLKGAARDKLVQRAAKLIAAMPATLLAIYRKDLADAMGFTQREFNNLIQVEKKEKKDDGNEKPAEIIETLGGWFPVSDDGEQGWLVEYLYDKNSNKAKFAFRDPEGKLGEANFLDINGARYFPMSPSEGARNGKILFASELYPHSKSARELAFMVDIFLRRYFLLDNPLQYRMGAYYVLLSWLYDNYQAIPFLRARGDTNTGKSELMLRLGYLCYRMVITTGISSTASFRQLAHKYGGTLLMDEMDITDKFDERVVMLNTSAMRDQAVIWMMTEVVRSDGTRGFEEQSYNVYGPKLITMYGKFNDPATENRCLTFEMTEHEQIELQEAKVPVYKPAEFYEESQTMRNMLLRWRLENWQRNRKVNENELMDLRVSTRINQVTIPIKDIASSDPDMLQEVEDFILSLHERSVNERSKGLDARVFDAILAALEEEEYQKYVEAGHIQRFGHVKYIQYKYLAKITNSILDEMNVVEEDKPDHQADEGKKKKREEGIQPITIGKIADRDLRIPTHRMGKGWVVILDEKRIEILKVKYGLAHQRSNPKQMELERYEQMADEGNAG